MKRPLVHVGLHRTGSSWFQRKVLDGRDGRPRNAVQDRSVSTAKLVLPRDLDFDPGATRGWLADAFARSEAEGSPPVISNERFSGNPAAGWHDAERTAHRLHDVAPQARILLIVREQEDLLRSIWRQQVRIGSICSLEDFLRPLEVGDHRLPAFDPEFLRFDRYVGLLDEIFGRDSVLVLPFELLRRDMVDYLGRIESFSGFAFPPPAPGGPVYASPPHLECDVRRRMNLLTTRSSLHRSPPFPWAASLGNRVASIFGRMATRRGEARRTRRARRLIDARLADLDLETSNRRLAERTGIDLGGLGWRV